MLIYFSIIFILYYIFVLLLLYGWVLSSITKNDQKSADSDLFVSIVVAVRNEAKNISKLLSALECQSYPKDRFEVIVVDDRSEDDTVGAIQNFLTKSKVNLQLASINDDGGEVISPKKAALAAGISMAKGSIIATTDGDCWMGRDWLGSMADAFSNPKTMFASGPVAIEPGSGMFSQIQSLEFSSLIGSGAALIQLNYPLMCNGANLAFRKEAFDGVGGYDGVDQHASGDDVFLMQKIHARYEDSIVFNKNSNALVYTSPLSTIRELIMQRRRWASKWNTYRLPLSWILPGFLFFHYLSYFGILMVPIIWPRLLFVSVLFITVKFILDFIFLKKVMKFCNLQMRFGVFLVSELMYPFYAFIIGVLVHIGKWTWKGGTYKT